MCYYFHMSDLRKVIDLNRRYTKGESLGKYFEESRMREPIIRRRSWAQAIFWWLLVIAWFGLILYLSAQTGERSGEMSMLLADKLYGKFRFLEISKETFHSGIRLLAHVGIFMVEGFLLEMAFINSVKYRGLSGIWAILMSIPMAVVDEWRKQFVEGRHCQWDEAAINAGSAIVGVLIAAALAWILNSIYIRHDWKRMVREQQMKEQKDQAE